MREICTSGSMRGEAATMVTLVPPLLLYWLDFSAASLGKLSMCAFNAGVCDECQDSADGYV